jgi:hypothetical protein
MSTFAKLQKLKQEYKDVNEARKQCDQYEEEQFFRLGDTLESLQIEIALIEDNIPRPPRPYNIRRVNILGYRLDNKGRRIKLPNGKYAR